MTMLRRGLMVVMLVSLILSFGGDLRAQDYFLNYVKQSSIQITRLQKPGTISTSNRHTIGDRLQINGRVFYYARIGVNTGIGTETQFGLALVATNTTQLMTGLTHPGVVASTAGTSVSVVLNLTVEDSLVGGYLVFRDSVNSELWSSLITANEASASSGDTVVITVAEVTPTAIVSGDTITVTANIYQDVVVPSSTNHYSGVVGIVPFYNPSNTDYEGSFAWIQTWGVLATEVASSGGGKGERAVYHTTSGTLAVPAIANPTDTTSIGFITTASDSIFVNHRQQIGFLLPRASLNSDLLFPLVFITIRP